MTSFFWIAAILCAAVGFWTIGLAIGRGVNWMFHFVGLYRDGIRDIRLEDD